MSLKNASARLTRTKPSTVLRRLLAGVFGMALCAFLATCIAMLFAQRTAVLAQNADLQAIARHYPKFTRQQRMALLQARQAQQHPKWRDLSFSQAVARLAMFVGKELSHRAAALAQPAVADFAGNLTQIQAPDNLALIRQSDCSLTLDDFTYQYTFGGSPTGSIVSTTTHYDQTLHTEAGLTTTGGKFPKGCADPTLGLSTRRAVYLGKTSSGLSMFAGAGYYAPSGANALIYGTGNVATGSVSTFTTDTSDPNIVAITAGDLNGDGMPDLVGIDQLTTGASVSVYLVHADGTISASISYPVIGTASEAATIDDVNGDGKLDVIVASIDSSGQEYVSVLTGQGDGTLKAAVSIKVPTPSTPDGAGGSGGSTPPVVNSTLPYKIVNVITADTRGTGHKDIITSAGIVLLNNGSGSFTVSASTAFAPRNATSSYGPNLAAGDLNNDGKQDLVLNDGSEVSVYLSNGDGSFTAGAVYASTSDVGYVTVTDLDGDGNADVYVGLANGGYFGGDQFSLQSAYALMGNGDGTLEGAPALPFLYNGNNIADVNNDGVLDGVGFSGNTYTGTAAFTTYLGNQNGTFTQQSTLQLSPATVSGRPCYFGGIDSYALGDVNGDGYADIVYLVPDCNSGGIFLATAKGDGSFNAPVFVQSVLPGVEPSINSIQIADFNHDGKADVAYIYQSVSTDGTTTNGGFAVQLGNGDGTFKAPQVVQTASTAGTGVATPYTQVAAVGDINGDGSPDVFVTIQSVCNTSPCTADIAFQLYVGNGDGTFKSPYNMPTDPAVPGGLQDSFSQIILADMNGDGHPDVVAAQPVSVGGIEIYLGSGNGTFATPIDLNIAAAGIAVADFNGDGKLDVAILGDGEAGICLGNGDGTLQSTTNSYGYPAPSQSILFDDFFYPAFTADFNHDGKPDLLFANTLLLSGTAATSTAPTLAATSTQLTASPTTAAAGVTVNFTATVSETAGTSTPTGTVTFTDGSMSIGTASLTSGVATFSTATLGVGTHSITAAYGGDTANAVSSSSSVVVTITAVAPADFSLALSPTSGAVGQGSSLTSTITLTPTGGFNQAVSFTCSGLPANSTCSFNPASVTLDGTSASTSQLTIATNVKAAFLRIKPLHSPGAPTSLAMLAGGGSLGLLLLRRRRKGVVRWLLPVALIATSLSTVAVIGCGHGSSAAARTPTGTSQVTVTAAAGSTVHTATYSLTVQ